MRDLGIGSQASDLNEEDDELERMIENGELGDDDL